MSNFDKTLFVNNLIETVVLQCKNNLKFKNDISIQGVLAVTMDSSGILLIPFDSTWSRTAPQSIQKVTQNIKMLPKVNDDNVTNNYEQYPQPSVYPTFSNSPSFRARGQRGNRRILNSRVRSQGSIPATPRDMVSPRRNGPPPFRPMHTFKKHISMEQEIGRQESFDDFVGDDQEFFDEEEEEVISIQKPPPIRRKQAKRSVSSSNRVEADDGVENVTILSDTEDYVAPKMIKREQAGSSNIENIGIENMKVCKDEDLLYDRGGQDKTIGSFTGGVE